MAIELERDFIRKYIKGPDVFEFGCGNGIFAKELSTSYNVEAVDLFTPETTEGFKFNKMDILDMNIDKKFNTVIAVSSLEHCGIETGQCTNPDYGCIDSIARILEEIALDKIIITAPFGVEDIMFTQKNGPDDYFENIENPEWGYRVFNVQYIDNLFANFKVVNSIAYKYTTGDYFDVANWELLKQPRYQTIQDNKAVICAVLERKV